MLPRRHIVFGGLFALFLWLAAPDIPLVYLALVFLASVFIDIDHYACAVWKTGQWHFGHALEYYRKQGMEMQKKEARGLKPRSDFHLFHTIEFHVLIALLGTLWAGFFYLFIGMVFHSLLDIVDALRRNTMHRREYFFFNWLRRMF